MKYAGDVTSVDAFNILKNDNNSFLIDVRTTSEWAFTGLPDLSSIEKETYTISWIFFPEMRINDNFADEVQENFPDKNAKLFFLCKSGGRSASAAAAMTEKGYSNCFNILGGFEGIRNQQDPQRSFNGWKAEMLPWRQG